MLRLTTEAPVAKTGPPLMTALKLPLGVTFVEHVSHNALPPSLGQGDQFPDPPLHVAVDCAKAGLLTSPPNARATTTIRNRKLTGLVTNSDERPFIHPPSFIAFGRGLQTCLPSLEARTPHSYCITYCTFRNTFDGDCPVRPQPLEGLPWIETSVPAAIDTEIGPESATWPVPRSSP